MSEAAGILIRMTTRADYSDTQANATCVAPASVAAGGRGDAERAADLRRLAARAVIRAREQIGRPWTSDPGLRVQVEAILALPPEDRIRMLEADVAVLSALRPAAG